MIKVEASIKIRIIAQGKLGPMATNVLDVTETRETVSYDKAF